MKAKELMIGDWVDYRGICNRIAPADFCHFEWIDKIRPIPLTPEILEKNGFRLDTYSGEFMSGKWWTRNDFVIHESMNDSIGKNNFSYKYVHQLQHALRLCGIEKEIIL
jgi:hypothetical protein